MHALGEIASLRAGSNLLEKDNNRLKVENIRLRAQLASAMVTLEDVPGETMNDRVMRIIEWHHSLAEDLRATKDQLSSARKALERVYDLLGRYGMANWSVAKRVREELDSLTDDRRQVMSYGRSTGFMWGLNCGVCLALAVAVDWRMIIGSMITAAACWVWRSNDYPLTSAYRKDEQ